MISTHREHVAYFRLERFEKLNIAQYISGTTHHVTEKYTKSVKLKTTLNQMLRRTFLFKKVRLLNTNLSPVPRPTLFNLIQFFVYSDKL